MAGSTSLDHSRQGPTTRVGLDTLNEEEEKKMFFAEEEECASSSVDYKEKLQGMTASDSLHPLRCVC